MREIVPLGFDLKAHYQYMASLGDRFDVSVLETIEHEGQEYPIYAADFQPDAGGERLYVLSGSHGNEEAGLLAVERYLEGLAEADKDATDVAIRVVTPHNPVGAAMFSRYNGDGYDVNRDFSNQKTAETRAVIKSLDDFRPTAAITMHEGPQEVGSFFFSNPHVRQDMIGAVVDDLDANGIDLATKSYFGNRLKHPGQFPATGTFRIIGRLLEKMTGFAAFESYCERIGVPAMVMETPWSSAESLQRVESQLFALNALTRFMQKT